MSRWGGFPYHTNISALLDLKFFKVVLTPTPKWFVGGENWSEGYPLLRDYLVASQIVDVKAPARHGLWYDRGGKGGQRVSGKPGELYGTAVACFILSIPNRYLPILQEGKIESLRGSQSTGG